MKATKIKIMGYRHKIYAAFNCQGLNCEIKKINTADDFFKYNLIMMIIQETKVLGSGIRKTKSLTEKILHLYNSGLQSKSVNRTVVVVTPVVIN